MFSNAIGSTLTALAATLLTFIVSTAVSYMADRGEIQFLSFSDGKQHSTIIVIDSWRSQETGKFKFILPNSGHSRVIGANNPTSVNIDTDARNDSVITVDNDSPRERLVLSIETEKRINSNVIRLLSAPSGYKVVDRDGFTYRYITLGALLNAILYGLGVGVFIFYSNRARERLSSQLDDIKADLRETKAKSNAEIAKIEKHQHDREAAIARLKVLILQRMRKMADEIEMWRRIFERIAANAFDSRQSARIALADIIKAGGGEVKIDVALDAESVKDEKLLELLERIKLEGQ